MRDVVLFCLALIGIAAIGVGALVGRHLGYPKLGIVAGFVLAIASLIGLGYVAAWFQRHWQPHFPRCRSGTCKFRDYRVIDVYVAQRVFVVRCRCGEDYVRVGGMPDGERRFTVLSPDGALQPYLYAGDLFERWQPDNTAAWDSVDSAATLQDQLQQLGYEAREEPTPQFPVYVLSWDDRTFQRVDDERGLRYYEQPDLEEGRHVTWDSLGRRFTLHWDRQSREPLLVFVNEDGIDSFRKAVEECARAMGSHVGRSLPRRLCDPVELECEIQQMTYRKEAAGKAGDSGSTNNGLESAKP